MVNNVNIISKQAKWGVGVLRSFDEDNLKRIFSITA